MIALVPSYIWPTDDAAFLRALSGYVPGVSVVTGPNSGPGTARSAALAGRIEWLREKGWTAIGYVRLDYLRRPLLDIAADVARWREWYPEIGGFFFDECPTLKLGALEAAKALQALAIENDGVSVFNTGAPVDPSWFDALAQSVIVTFEGTAQTYATLSPQRHARAAHLVYGATGPVSVSGGYGATTTDGEPGDPNPWDADGVAAPGVAWDADRLDILVDLREPAEAASGVEHGRSVRGPAAPVNV